jgi:hypothetical protein
MNDPASLEVNKNNYSFFRHLDLLFFFCLSVCCLPLSSLCLLVVVVVVVVVVVCRVFCCLSTTSLYVPCSMVYMVYSIRSSFTNNRRIQSHRYQNNCPLKTD